MNATRISPELVAFETMAKAASPIVLAIKECDPELREEVMTLFAQLHEGGLDEEQTFSTCALIAEILFPNADENGYPGLDLEQAEKIASNIHPDARPILERMDREEADFANRLRALMEKQGITQADLAKKVGIGQPAVSMMLNRACRPQRKTIARFAEALGVSPDMLWPPVQS